MRVNEKRFAARGIGNSSTTGGNVFAKSLRSNLAERNYPLFFTFPQNTDGPLNNVDVPFIDTDEFPDTKPRSIQQLQDGTISEFFDRCILRHFDNGCSFSFSQKRRQLLRQAWEGNQLR